MHFYHLIGYDNDSSFDRNISSISFEPDNDKNQKDAVDNCQLNEQSLSNKLVHLKKILKNYSLSLDVIYHIIDYLNEEKPTTSDLDVLMLQLSKIGKDTKSQLKDLRQSDDYKKSLNKKLSHRRAEKQKNVACLEKCNIL